MAVRMDFNRTLLNTAITAVLALSISKTSASQCSGIPASEGGDIVISTGQGETCSAVTVNATPDINGNGRVGDVSIEGTIQDSSGSAGIYINAHKPFDNGEANIGTILNNGSINSSDDGIRVGGYEQRATGVIGNIINTGEIKSDRDGIDITLDGNGKVGTVENRGTIQSQSSRGIFTSLYGASRVESIVNSGSIRSGDDDDAVMVFARENSSIGSVANSGDIQSGYWGLAVQTNTGIDDNGNAQIGEVTNSGTINAKEDALYVFAKKGTIGDVVNSGTLVSENDYGLYIRTFEGGTIGTVINSGSVTSVNDDAIRVEGLSHTLINTGTITGKTNFKGGVHTFVMAGGVVNGDIEGASTIQVTGSAELTGNITGYQPYYSNIDGVKYAQFDTDDEYNTFLANAAAAQMTITDTGRLQLAKDSNISSEVNLNQQGTLAVSMAAENNLQHQSPVAKLTLQSQVVRVGNPASSELVTLTTPAATFSENASVLVTPDYRGDFVYGDTEQYRVLSAAGGINGTPTVVSSSILFTAEESSIKDGQHLDVTIGTTNLTSTVEENTSDALAAQVAGLLQNYLTSLNQTAAADFIENEQLLAMSNADELVDYLKQHYPNFDNDSLASVIAATEQIQGEVFNNVLAHLANLRNGGRSGVSAGDIVEQGGVWFKAITSKADQGSQSSKGVNYNGYNSRLNGFSLGGDVVLSDTYTLGSSFSYAKADVNVKNSAANSDIESYQLSLYSNWLSADWFIDSIINFGFNTTKSESYSGNVKATSDYDSKQYGLHVTGGKEFWFNNQDTLVEPRISFEYSHLDTDSYTLDYSDGSTPAKVKSDDFTIAELGAGVRMSHLVEMDDGILLPEASFMILHDFVGDTLDSTVTAEVFNQSLVIRTIGVEPMRTSYVAGLGVDYWMDNDISLSLNYEHRWASGFKSDSLQAQVRYDF